MTQYPDNIDTRVNNLNMKGFENLKDYALAEHVNALEDAVMALQRALGIKPMYDKDNVDRSSVANRIKLLEGKDYDSRYGGSGWINTQTLVGHSHTGALGHPSQISLSTEVQGTLPKSKLSFDASSGITGADLFLSSTDARKLPEVINDKLSISQGGTIRKDLEVQGRLASRLFREWDATDSIEGTQITDYTTLINKAARGAGTVQVRYLHHSVQNFLYGTYVLAVRARVSSRVSEEVLHLRMHDMFNTGWVLQNYLYIKGTDFDAANQWQTFYLTFEHGSNVAAKDTHMHVWKPATSNNINVDFDCAWIMPTHPAIYDR
jgi:hypothetical protein